MYTYCELDPGTVWRRKNTGHLLPGTRLENIYSLDGWEVLTRDGWKPHYGVTPKNLQELTMLTEAEARQNAKERGIEWS